MLFRFAQGQELPDDFKDLKNLVNMSQNEVFAAEIYLEENRVKTVALLGADVAEKVDYLIDVKMGCGRLLKSIGEQAALGITAEQARQFLKRIVHLNELTQGIAPP